MILQKSFKYDDRCSRNALLLTVLKTVLLLNIFVEIVMHFFHESFINRKLKGQPLFLVTLLMSLINLTHP